MSLEHIQIFTKDIKIKYGNMQQLASELARAINLNNEGIYKFLKVLINEHYKESVFVYVSFRLICDKLEDIYGVNIDFEDIKKTAHELIEKNWDEYLKKAKEISDIEQQIDDIFKDKKE